MTSANISIGFIGLGAMGKPMAEQLTQKLPSGTKVIIYDVVESVMKELSGKYPSAVVEGSSPKDVAEKSVSL